MPTFGHSSFRGKPLGAGDLKTHLDQPDAGLKAASAKAPVYKWSDQILKQHGSSFDRVVLAIRDAASCAVKRRKDPCKDPIYVTKTIREGWQLTSKDLSRGLKQLEELGRIVRTTPGVRGRNARFTLVAEMGASD